jgi:hypothetical protein
MELYLHSPNSPSWRGAQLKHRDNFTFYLLEEAKMHLQKHDLLSFISSSVFRTSLRRTIKRRCRVTANLESGRLQMQEAILELFGRNEENHDTHTSFFAPHLQESTLYSLS